LRSETRLDRGSQSLPPCEIHDPSVDDKFE